MGEAVVCSLGSYVHLLIVFGSLVLINQKAFLKCLAVSFSSKLLLLPACLVAAGGACSLSVGGAVLPSSAVSLGLNSHVGPLLTLPHLSHQFLHVSLCALH